MVALVVEFYPILDSVIPCGINTELDSLSVDPHGSVQDLREISEFHFGGHNDFHAFNYLKSLFNVHLNFSQPFKTEFP